MLSIKMTFKWIFLNICLIVTFYGDVTCDVNTDVVSRGYTRFANQLYQTAAKTYPGNIIISPYSVQKSLLFLYMGASNNTADEISTALGISSLSRLDIATAFLEITKSVEQNNLLKVATNLFIAPNFTPTRRFKALTSSLDFTRPDYAAFELNKWVEEQTNGKISNLFQSQDITSDIKMLLLNAIHFKGEWKQLFKEKFTKKSSFWVSANESIKVDTMYASLLCKSKIFSDYNFEAVELPYKNSNISMLILLPLQRNGISGLEETLNRIDILDVTKNMEEDYISVWLPKFKVETELDLENVLRQMNIQTVFTSAANFDQFFDHPAAVQVSKAIHKAVIEVDEQGAEAAAADGFAAIAISADPEFHANHPFIYVIKNKDTLLFMGSVKQF